MENTGVEHLYVTKYNKKLRCGYTTGSCAAAASKAAAWMLLSGMQAEQVSLMTPKGILLHLKILDIDRKQNAVSCAVRKDGGDDPDATNGILVYSKVSFRERKEPSLGGQEEEREQQEILSGEEADTQIFIDGGVGVGRVTRKGLQVPVGEAAINPVPRKMIREAVEEVCREFEYRGELDVLISIPRGREIAGKTFNPRLGIQGGLSVLGTSGIVVPMSEAALIASIRVEMEMKKAEGREYLLITPGNYGEAFTREHMTVDLSSSVKCSNYVGETLDMAVELGIKGVLFVAHVGKFIKVAGGIMNTHSREADSRAELMAAFALRAGADADTARQILETITTDEALEIMERAGVRQKAMELAAGKVREYLQHRVGGGMLTEAILFSGAYGYLGETRGAGELLKHFEKITAQEERRNI